MIASKVLGQWQYPKVINIIMPKSNRCSSIPKYPGVVTMRERVLERQEQKLGYRFGSIHRQNNIQERKQKVTLIDTTGDRQERGREGRKIQEDTRKMV